GQYNVCHVQLGWLRRRVIGVVIYSRSRSHVDIDAQETAACKTSLVVHAISTAQNSLVLSKPRKRPTESHGGSKRNPVIVIQGCSRIWRVLAHELRCCERAAFSRFVPVGEAGAGQAEEVAVLWPSHHAVRFIRRAEPFPSDTEIEREIVCHLPVVFEERHPLVLVEIPVFLVIVRVVEPRDVFWIRLKAERLTDVGDRTGQISQQVPNPLLIESVEAGNACG